MKINITRTSVVVAVAGILLATLVASLMPALTSAKTGNGAPSGSHYTLNFIGVAKDKTAGMDGNNGHRIFVPLSGKTKIYLQEGDDFEVLDANATDGSGKFQLPDPGLDAYVVGEKDGKDTTSDYSVFVRPLGKPGGWATITTCADLLDSSFSDLLGAREVKNIRNRMEDTSYCSIEQVGSEITMRTKGKSTFTNVTAELLTIVFEVEVDTTGDGEIDDTLYIRVPIFDELLENEYWEYDNNGLRLLQARFYPVGTDVSAGDGNLGA